MDFWHHCVVRSIEEIQVRVANRFNISMEELTGSGNKRAVVIPRQMAMYIAKKLTDSSLPEIGRQFGGKRHTAVMNSIAKIENLRHTDQAVEIVLLGLLAALKDTE